MALDPAEADNGLNGIATYRWTGAAFSSSQDFRPLDESLSDAEFDMSHEQVRKLLYNIEDLRKQQGGHDGDEEQADEAEHTEQAGQPEEAGQAPEETS